MLYTQRIVWTLVMACFVVLPALGKPVTVMSYNVENMFDVFDDPYSDDDGVAVKRRGEIVAIAKAIAAADADVVVFQELENEHLLQGMVDTFLKDQGYEYVACQRTNSGRGINLGVISKLPIKRLTSHRFKTLTHPDAPGRAWKFARDAMQVTLDVDGKELHLFNVHLKSNSSRNGDPNSKFWRTAEAMALKGLIREMFKKDPDALVVALGDFNSNIETRPEQVRPWPATEYIRKPEADGTQLLNDAHDEIDDYDKRVTIPGSGRYPAAIFDYIYASPKLHTMFVKGSAKVINDPKLVKGSDHYPVYATYDIK
ncbi:MAG: endonuclease/exonuclease/phosphatase family protein [Phycisphaeraceae bacterium]|nr:endonuclease/exonuclease/phosphatase family protein [Phycisphaeraceae bacterium]